MVGGCGLVIPDVARISINMAALESFRNSFRVANRATGGVDNPNALFRAAKCVLVEKIASTLMQGAVHSNNIALHGTMRSWGERSERQREPERGSRSDLRRAER